MENISLRRSVPTLTSSERSVEKTIRKLEKDEKVKL